MGWMQKLCEAYDAGICADQSKEAVRLVPAGFSSKKVKYHVVLSRDGEFVSADELPEESQMQIIPSTPQAESRTGDNGAPYPLTEQMKYLVYEEKNITRYNRYIGQLKDWCEQPDTPECLQVVLSYLEKHTLLDNLYSQPSLKLKYYKDEEKKKELGADGKAMICFSVQMQDEQPDDLWMREDVRKSWNKYRSDKLPGDRAFCYVDGRVLPGMESHPKLFGNPKLISSKDADFPFQYKGRFVEDRSAAVVSISASERIHSTLLWLILRQGLRKYGMSWVVWNTNGAEMHVPIDERNEFMRNEEEVEEEDDAAPVVDTFSAYAKAVRDAALGYAEKLHDYDPKRTNSAAVLGLEAATDGRMSITYYQECPGNLYVEHLENWYRDCCWWQYNWSKKEKEIATPKIRDISIAVLGSGSVKAAEMDSKCEKSNTKLLRKLQSRLLSCIVDEQPLPRDVVLAAFNRACLPQSFVGGNSDQWSRSAWESNVDTVCAMISCYQGRCRNERVKAIKPELEIENTDRDYLYGRLLAVADLMEERAAEQGRDYPTNAIRSFQKFMQSPFKTWMRIHEKLIPSIQKLGVYAKIYQIEFEKIEELFSKEDRCSTNSLSFEFLQGFSSERQKMRHDIRLEKTSKSINSEENKEGDNVLAERMPYTVPTTRSELYGCLLAIADRLEQEAGGEERFGRTNALQMMIVFSSRPFENWSRLHEKLIPYLEKLGSKITYYQKLIGMVEAQFEREDRESEKPLDSSYLHGYYGMLQTFYRKTEYIWQPKNWEKEVTHQRSAWYGMMLGIEDRTENRAISMRMKDVDQNERRMTNALRQIAAFSRKPETTWKYLRVKLAAYLKIVPDMFETEQFLSRTENSLQQSNWATDAPLSSIYLHYYYAERNKKGEIEL